MKRSFYVVTILSIILTACTHQEERIGEYTTPTDKNEQSLSFFEDVLGMGVSLDMSEKEVRTLLSEPSAIGISEKDGAITWRYDYIVSEDYTFQDADMEVAEGESQVVDIVDVEGLIHGDMELQLFITWNEGVINKIVVLHNDSGRIKEYWLIDKTDYDNGGAIQHESSERIFDSVEKFRYHIESEHNHQ
ncbi:hypothetical protein [Longirhabdus pacifica]|uniref:hypothetical protein n=1 Tax=Longirhabdus pacifica TaxID=2305227 RepID=UPI0010093C84|nr:hypothetical protein [Longirhabdus pacifica]